MSLDCIRSPLGCLLDEIRQEKVKAAGREGRAERPRAAGPEPALHIEAGVVSGGATGRDNSPRSWRWAPAIAVHAALIAAIVLVPLLVPEELPSPATGTRAFLVQTLVAPPPPPPAAAPVVTRTAARPEARKAEGPSPTAATIAPQVKPEDVIDNTPPAPPALIADEGVPGGVEGGVPGGIVGGVMEPASANEPAPSSVIRVGGEIKEPRKLKNVAPVYPAVAARGKIEGVVILEIAIQPSGRVEDVRVLRGIPLLDAAAVDAARQWVFAPTLYRGVPVSVTMTVSVRFSLTSGAAAS
jgi:protein TonB